MVDLAHFQQVRKESDRKGENPQVVRVHNHDPVFDEVRQKALLPDESHDPIHGRVELAILDLLGQPELLLVSHHVESHVDYRPELLVLSEAEKEGRILGEAEATIKFLVRSVRVIFWALHFRWFIVIWTIFL